MLDLLATGYPSMDHILPVSRNPAVGETGILLYPVDDRTAHYGGCGANVAVGLRRLGFHTGVAMVVGDDASGRAYRDYLHAAGVDIRNLVLLPGQLSSRSYIFSGPEGEVQNFFFAGAAAAWSGDLSLQGLDAVRWGLVTVGPYAYNHQFVRLLVEHGIPLIWQLKPDVAAYPPGAVQEFTRASRVIFCNRIEADYLCQTLGLGNIRELLDRGVSLIVLTLGAAGARIIMADGEVEVPVIPRSVADTTGAGDGFTAGFLAGFLEGRELSACGHMAAAVASFVIEKVGCQTNLPDRQQLMIRCHEAFDEV